MICGSAVERISFLGCEGRGNLEVLGRWWCQMSVADSSEFVSKAEYGVRGEVQQ